MPTVKVLDTGVLIGIVVEQDQHHSACIDYVTGSDSKSFVPPSVSDEFKDKLQEVQDTLSEEIREHRRDIIKQYDKNVLNITDIVTIRENLVDTDSNAHRFLFEFYDKIKERGQLQLSDLKNMLSNMATEVYKDGARSYGGFGFLVSIWTKGVDTYPQVRSNLLITEGDDPDVCLEAHHVAESVDDKTELGTTNPKHFVRKRNGETESRKENILRETSLDDIVDLSMSKYP